jgi:hypothetical protein
VSEWIGWAGRLRRTIYARMEQLSFRTGAATVAGVFAVAVTAILLTLTQGGHHAAPPRAARSDAAPSRFLAGPPIGVFSTPATHRTDPSRAAAAPDVHYVPERAKTPTATAQASPPAGLPSRWPTPWKTPPATHAPPSVPTGYPWPWPTPTPSNQWDQPAWPVPSPS